MKNLKRLLLQGGILVGGVVFGLLALLLVHLLPVEKMRENVYWSLEMIAQEFENEEVIYGHPATLTGNFTDCLMLEYAVYSAESHSTLEQVLHMYRGESYYEEGNEDGWQPGESLRDYLEFKQQPREVEYGRYWHGYLVILKPILLLTSVNTLRLINSVAQLFGAGAILILLTRKKAEKLAAAFLLSLPFLYYVSSFASLSLSVCMYLMLAVVLFQTGMDERIVQSDKYAEFFLITGMLTSYFDLLTYPLITLGYPLCIYCYFHKDKLVVQWKKVVCYSVEWFVGYVGMWAGKWILSDLLSDSHVLADAWYTVITRTGSADQVSRVMGFFQVVEKNIQMYGNWCYVLIVAMIAVAAVCCIKKTVKGKRHAYVYMAIYLWIAMYPFCWFFLLENHSVEHWIYTCRILAVSIFAIGTGLAALDRELT